MSEEENSDASWPGNSTEACLQLVDKTPGLDICSKSLIVAPLFFLYFLFFFFARALALLSKMDGSRVLLFAQSDAIASSASGFCFLSLCRLRHLLFPTLTHRALGGLAISVGILSVRSKVKSRFTLRPVSINSWGLKVISALQDEGVKRHKKNPNNTKICTVVGSIVPLHIFVGL